MAYIDFTLAKVQQDFDLTLEERQNLFAEIEHIEPSDLLKQILEDYVPLATAINTEKARSEMMIAPILLEVRRQLKAKSACFQEPNLMSNPNKDSLVFATLSSVVQKNSFLWLRPLF